MSTLNIVFFTLFAFFTMIINQTFAQESDEKYYIYQTYIGGDVDPSKCAKCYRSAVKKKYKKDYIEIKTDSITFTSYILRRQEKRHGFGRNEIREIEILTANKDKVYQIREVTLDNYYLTIIPVKLNLKSDLGGIGDLLLISDNKHVCDSLITYTTWRKK